MASFSIAEAVLTGPSLLRRRPMVLSAWVVFQFVVAVLTDGLLVLVAGPALNQLTHASSRTGGAGVLPMLAQVLPGYLAVLLVSMTTFAVTCAAVNRAILRPGESRFAYLRLGGDELRQFALTLIFTVIGVGVYIGGAVLGGLIVALLSIVLGPALGGAGSSITVIFVMIGVIIAGMLLLAVRFSLASAQTFDTRQVNPFGSWALTRGHFWKILATWLIVLAGSAAVIAAAFALTGVTNMALDTAHHAFTLVRGSDMSSLRAFFTPQVALQLTLFSLAYGVIWPVFLSPFATTYQRLAPLQSLSGATVAEVFG